MINEELKVVPSNDVWNRINRILKMQISTQWKHTLCRNNGRKKILTVGCRIIISIVNQGYNKIMKKL